ncbi:hypothetical protein MKS88_000568 [Plasmodium brasilianum]|uniref:Uncharacterized protein n=1 Tax=Plasmodium brasilianum TaxID=5824 RepID=A0ACB9YHW8_PLABR|nr:hypothetical protein MKS88_000568 [Plasmodium brasilianum]
MSWHGYGFSSSPYILNGKFKNIRKHIIKITSSLKNQKKKKEFRETCLELADYLIKENHAPPGFEQSKWDQALKNWNEYQYDKIRRHGGCPMIIEKNDRDLLELKYEAEDFYERRDNELKQLRRFQLGENTYDCKTFSSCTKRLQDYNVWINKSKKYFEEKKMLIEKNSKTEHQKIKFKIPVENLMNPQTFSELSKYSITDPVPPDETKENQNEKGQITAPQETPRLAMPSHQAASEITSEKALVEDITDARTTVIQVRNTEQGSDDHELASASDIGDTPVTTTSVVTEDAPIIADDSASEDTIVTGGTLDTTVLDVSRDSQITSSSAKVPGTSSFQTIAPKDQIISGITKGMFKNKKDIKRRQVKFLRIITPSHYKKKIQFLSHDNLEDPINDGEQIIKKIKIQEHNINKNKNTSLRKKDRSITIIEVHMEILEECRNKEWEYNKGEFLEICQEVLKKEENRIDTNLTDDEVIMENIKSTNDIENQKILWNKWMQRHKNFSEKLRKECWFNNLKNEWKEEKSYVKNSEEFKKLLSSDNKKDPFLEREKDTWTQWISKKGTFVEQYLEKDWFERLTEEVYNMSDAYENEGKKNDSLFINKEELENKENYEELCKYFKTKLLKKLCILVFMMILEDCKKEEYIENRESHFDNSINEWMTEENSDNKPEIEENLIDTNSDILQNRKNNKINTYKGEDCLRQELDEWIKENDAHVNSLYSNNNVDKFDQIVE